MPTIICTVTNDLSYDQRMQRICTALAGHGYELQLVGRILPHSIPLDQKPYKQHRLQCRFNKGLMFYAEFNLRLWAYLLRARYDAVCSVDLDTLPAGCLATVLRRKKRLFDAHEYFTEVPELSGRPVVQFFWSVVARVCLPFYRHAYTVGPALAAIFEKKYGVHFGVVRNVTASPPTPPPKGRGATPLPFALFPEGKPPSPLGEGLGVGSRALLYQGALNQARGIEFLLKAMQQLEDLELWLAGEGDLSESLRQMAIGLKVSDKVRFLGLVQPNDLKTLTEQAWLGINVLENQGLSYYYSLANKFFDYVHAGVPVLTMNFPEYRALNQEFEVAVLLEHLSVERIVHAIRHLQENPETYQQLQVATQQARLEWTWEKEEARLLRYWKEIFETKL